MNTFFSKRAGFTGLRSYGTYAVLTLAGLGMCAQAYAYTTIGSQLDMYERNTDVTHLQEFLAGNPTWYPSGLVTGYFGTLTKSAVISFQNAYSLDAVGRVGPLTRDKINALITNGGAVVTNDATGPAIYKVAITTSSNSESFSFNTSEPVTVRVVYSTSPLMFNEGDINSVGFGPIGGNYVTSAQGLSTSHTVTVQNLNSQTRYYVTIIATDQSGNVSAWGPNQQVTTN